MRKTGEVTISAEGRDKGKVFLITEMPASQGEAWAVRALSAMAKSGVEIPDDIIEAGWAALAFVGIRALLASDYRDVGPLLDEMMACVQIKTDAMTRKIIEEDIEEIATRVFLRDEVYRLHANFSLIESLSSAITSAAQARAEIMRTMQTSTEESQP